MDELPMEEHPFFLDAAEEDSQYEAAGEEAEEVIQEIAQELDGQIISEAPDEAVHVDDFVVPMPRPPRQAAAKEDTDCIFDFEEESEESAQEDEIFAVLESEPDEGRGRV